MMTRIALNTASVILILSVSLTVAQSAKILFVSSTPSTSHQKLFTQVWHRLGRKGHEVHVVTPNPLQDSNLTNLVQYNISEVYIWMQNINEEKPTKIKDILVRPGFWKTLSKEVMVLRAWNMLYEWTFSHPQVKKLITTKPKLQFDVVIVEWLYPSLAAFGGYFEAPLIGICSLGAPTNGLDAIGNILNPVVVPDQNIPLRRNKLSFRDRLLSVLYSIWIRILGYWYVLPLADKTIKKHFGENMPYLGEMERNISLLLLNRNQISHRVMPLVPGIVEFGGYHYVAIKDLSPELKTFLDKSKRGVIYFSLGAAIKQTTFLSPEQREMFKRVFGSLPYNIVWKWENESMTNKPDNVFIQKWLNQNGVLEHPNVKLFITQGGLQSIEEAIAAHKPIIGIPFHSDQTTNVDTCVQYGMGKMMDLDELTEETLRSYILEVIENPSYTENARKLDELMKDQPQDGIDKAIWWIEYVIRHKGAKHLRSIAVDLPWWQYLMLDVLGFIFAVVLSVLTLLYLLVRAIVKIFSKMFCSKKEKAKAKKKKMIKNE